MDNLTVVDFYGLAHQLPRAQAEALAARGESLTITIYPEQLRAALGQDEPETADPRDDFSESDVLIARALDASDDPLTASEIADAITRDSNLIIDAAGVRRRMMEDKPLKRAGYRRVTRGYVTHRPGPTSPAS